MTAAAELARATRTPARSEPRRLRLRGACTYRCRRCRSPIRAVSSYYLPEACPACGAATWTAGRCACSATRRPGSRGRAFCHACGRGVWAREEWRLA